MLHVQLLPPALPQKEVGKETYALKPQILQLFSNHKQDILDDGCGFSDCHFLNIPVFQLFPLAYGTAAAALVLGCSREGGLSCHGGVCLEASLLNKLDLVKECRSFHLL